MIAAWHEAPTSISAPTRRAYDGRQRRSSTSPRMLPRPNSAVTSAHERAPSYSWSISTGPTTKIDGSTTAW